MPGPRKTPSVIAALRGNPSKEAKNYLEPQPRSTTADPPEYLTGAALELWTRHATEAVRLGTLTIIDREHFADGCCLIAEGRARFRSTGPVESLLPGQGDPVKQALAMLRQGWAMLECYGVGASNRTKIHVEPPRELSKWDRGAA